MTEIELGPRSLRVIGGVVYDAVAHIAKDQCPDWERVDYAIAELDRTAKPEANKDLEQVGRALESEMKENLSLHSDLRDLRAKLAESHDETARMAAKANEMESKAKLHLDKMGELSDRLAAIDEAAANLPEMPEEWRGIDGKQPVLYGADERLYDYAHALRSIAASLQVRVGGLESEVIGHRDNIDAMRRERDALQVENENLKVSVRNLKGAMVADDERLGSAGKRIGLEGVSCDTPDDMAEEILTLRQERDTAIQALRDEARLRGLAESQRDALQVRVDEITTAATSAGWNGVDNPKNVADYITRLGEECGAALAEAEGLRRERNALASDKIQLIDQLEARHTDEALAAARRQGAEEAIRRMLDLAPTNLCYISPAPTKGEVLF